MSASLVGSEMCIRDRGESWCGVAKTLATCHLISPGHLVTATPMPGSVSYTHLTLPTICSV
eukprot:12134030-Alexandrium_andersonii.AAC.1